MLTAAELARRWGCSIDVIYAETRAGRIPRLPTGRVFRYAEAAIARLEEGYDGERAWPSRGLDLPATQPETPQRQPRGTGESPREQATPGDILRPILDTAA